MSEQPEYHAWRKQFIAERGRPPTAYEAWAVALASRIQEQEGQPSTFPTRILTVLHELADRKGTPTHGPAEDANGEPLQDDADAALAWIAARQEERPVLSEKEAFMRTLGWQPPATLTAVSKAVQVPGWPDSLPCRVSVMHSPGDWDTFVYAGSGKITTEVLQSIEAALRGDDDSVFEKGPGEYLIEVSYFAGQYGFEGRCELAPGWEFFVVDFRPPPAAPQQPLAGGEVQG